MRSMLPPGCLTRVIVDDEHAIEVAQLRAAMQRIQGALGNLPAEQREYIASALLNLAVSRVIRPSLSNAHPA